MASLKPFMQEDPTRSVALRRRYAGAIRKRFRRIRGLIRETILENRALNLHRLTGTPPPFLAGNQEDDGEDEDEGVSITAGAAASSAAGASASFAFSGSGEAAEDFSYATRDDLDDEFINWLKRQQDIEVLEATRQGGPDSLIENRSRWEQAYVRAAYGKGMKQADTKMAALGSPPSDAGLDAVEAQTFNRPIHQTKLRQLYKRNFEALQTVKDVGTEDAAKIFREELTKGLAKGKRGPEIAEDIVERVNSGYGQITKHKANLVARTEVTNAHAQGTLNRFQQAGIEEVQGRAELITAGDTRVCPRCLALEGQKFKLREARNIIPVHPMCRCSWIPITGLSQEREQARQFARQRFDRIGMKPEQINPMNPNDSATKEALSRFGKVRRWEKGDRNEEPTFDTFNPATTL